jgi:hypothetical protein
MPADLAPFHFVGFSSPNTTSVPDDFFDVLAPRLAESELRVLIYIIRRTFGFKKESDTISLKQMVEGIRTRDGRVLDQGTGMSKPGVTKGVKGLVTKGVIMAIRNSSPERGDEPTTYRLRFRGDDQSAPVITRFTRGEQRGLHGGGNDVTSQETDQQETDQQGSFESSKAPPIIDTFVDKTDEPFVPQVVVHSPPIINLIADFSREMGDTKHLGSNVTQAHRIFAASNLGMDEYFTILYEARLRTRKTNGVQNRMSYFFSVLRDLAAPQGSEEPYGEQRGETAT